MNNHEHHKCKHEHLAYCDHCDVAYCKDCGREWKTEKIYTSSVWTTGTSPDYLRPPYTVTCNTVNGDPIQYTQAAAASGIASGIASAHDHGLK